MKPPTEELGLSGKGVAIPKIKALDEAAAEYQKAKKKRCAASPDEIATKQVLIALIHKHSDKLPKNEEGHTIYRNGDLRIELIPGKEKIRVTDDEPDEAESEGE